MALIESGKLFQELKSNNICSLFKDLVEVVLSMWYSIYLEISAVNNNYFRGWWKPRKLKTGNIFHNK